MDQVKRMNRVKRSVVVALFLGAACASTAAAAAGTTPIPLRSGSNRVDLLGTGEAGMAMLAHRENFNAHSFDVLTLYIKPPKVQGEDEDWQLVSVFDGEKEALTLTTGGGADCVLHDFRLVRNDAKGSAELIVAQREAGSSYAAAAPVLFKYYALRRNDDGDVGLPRYYYALVKKVASKKPYCDVGEAFSKELKIGAYR